MAVSLLSIALGAPAPTTASLLASTTPPSPRAAASRHMTQLLAGVRGRREDCQPDPDLCAAALYGQIECCDSAWDCPKEPANEMMGSAIDSLMRPNGEKAAVKCDKGKWGNGGCCVYS